METFKQKVVKAFFESVNERIQFLENALNELSESVMNETKSTAGDKHETALAMLQSEQSTVAQQLQEAIDQKKIYEMMDTKIQTQEVHLGSLVKTSKGYFFLSVALPKLKIDDQVVIGLSTHSPLGGKLLGLKVGDSVTVNKIEHQIEFIL